MVWTMKILCCQRQEVSILNISNNEISHYTTKKSFLNATYFYPVIRNYLRDGSQN